MINPQLEPNRHPLPIPEDLIRKLGGGYGFTKVDLAHAFSEINLGPETGAQYTHGSVAATQATFWH